MYLFTPTTKQSKQLYEKDGLPYYDNTADYREQRKQELHEEMNIIRKRLGKPVMEKENMTILINNSTIPNNVNTISSLIDKDEVWKDRNGKVKYKNISEIGYYNNTSNFSIINGRENGGNSEFNEKENYNRSDYINEHISRLNLDLNTKDKFTLNKRNEGSIVKTYNSNINAINSKAVDERYKIRNLLTFGLNTMNNKKVNQVVSDISKNLSDSNKITTLKKENSRNDNDGNNRNIINNRNQSIDKINQINYIKRIEESKTNIKEDTNYNTNKTNNIFDARNTINTDDDDLFNDIDVANDG